MFDLGFATWRHWISIYRSWTTPQGSLCGKWGRAVLAQSSDLDEALDGFAKKDLSIWTDEEKRKDCKGLSLIQLHLSNNILQ
jgi:hypothetical protein